MKFVGFGSFAIAITVSTAVAQQSLTKEEIIQSLVDAPATAEENSEPFDIEKLRSQVQNAIRVERREVNDAQTSENSATQLDSLPKIDIKIFFEYDSDAIDEKSIASLMVLGDAISDTRFENTRFLVGGHTDAAGSREYNMKLSERRAEAVREFLVRNFPIENHRLISIGFGEERLKDAQAPGGAINRRVEIANIGD